MKTQAERQKAVRERRIAEGAHRRLNMWISVAAYDALSQLAREQGVTRMEALNRLLCPTSVTASPGALAPVALETPRIDEAGDATASQAGPRKKVKRAAPAKQVSGRKKPRLAQLDLVLDVIAAQTPAPQQGSLFGKQDE